MVTAYDIATMVMFTSLGLVALALALVVRRYSAIAFAIGLVGLLGLTIGSTWLSYARSDTGEEAQREVQHEADKARAEVERLTVELGVEKVERANAKRDEKAAIAKAAELEKELSEAQQRPPPPQLVVTTRIDSGALRQLIGNRLDTPFYTSQPEERRALVTGLTGSWYVVRLKLGGKPFVFADRQFRMPEAMQEIKDSVLQLQNSIIALVQQGAKSTRLFLRGGADPRRLAGETEMPDARELQILQHSADGNYASVPQRVLIEVPVRNEDLPNLRADWLRQQIQPVLRAADIAILENPPAPSHERTVDLILYVEW